MSALALFDFDGTVSFKDSMAGFVRHAVGRRVYYMGMLKISPVLAAYVLKLMRNDVAKAKMMTHFFGGWEARRFHEAARRYALDHLDAIVRPEAMERIRWHREQGHTVVIVSASMGCWLQPWCDKEGVALIASKMQIEAGRVTGALDGPNCYGEEKVRRIRAVYDLEDFETVYAYGDTAGDRPMLALADEGFFKPFRG